MATIFVTDREGNQLEVDAASGEPLMYALRDIRNGVEAICGGMCSCATCHVYVDADWAGRLPDREAEEHELLAELEGFRDNSRLSCQIEVSDALNGIKVTVAPEE